MVRFRPLSIASKIAAKPTPEVAKEKIWNLDLDDDEVDLVDEDALLDEEDLKKPDPASLKGYLETQPWVVMMAWRG